MVQKIIGVITMKPEKNIRMSECFITVVFLVLSGGFQDAYTYFMRNHVFSNAQTGNLVIMGERFMTGRWREGLMYLFPLCSFALGVIVAEQFEGHFSKTKSISWWQGIVLMEMLILFVVGFMPEKLNTIATSMVSFSCAMQVQSFRKVNNYPYASTMIIGNMRSAASSLSEYIRNRNREVLKRSATYFGIIFVFFIGAGLGGVLSPKIGMGAIWISDILLFIAFLLMFEKNNKNGES